MINFQNILFIGAAHIYWQQIHISCVLIGDENLSVVRLSDLSGDCSVKTLSETKMDLARCWVQEKLDWAPSKCIIYCGKNDIIENDNLSIILDDFGALVAELKSKNENIELFVCELAPDMNEDVNRKIDSYSE